MLLELSPQDVSRIRFDLSPWTESVTAVRAIARPPGLHRPFADEARARLRGTPDAAAHWDLLRAFIVPGSFMADALTPTPAHEETFEQMRDRVVAQDAALWEEDLAELRRFGDRPDRDAVLDDFAADPTAGVERLAAAVTWVWEHAVLPHWERIRALEIADIDHRLALLSCGGLDEMLRTLHPEVHREPGGLEIEGKNCRRWPGSEGIGLTLIPSVFAWPGVLVLNRRPFVPAISYAPRGIGALWDHTERDAPAPLAALLGSTRASVLRQLDLPMTTTQLSRCLSISPATASEHLGVLSRAQLLATHRRGREVFYRRTELGERLSDS